MTVPFATDQGSFHAPHHGSRESLSSKKDVGLTIKASHAMQRGRSHQDNFASMRSFARGSEPLSPPKTAPLIRRSVDFAAMPSPTFPTMSDLKMDMPVEGGGYNPSIYSPLTNHQDSALPSFQSSPEVANVSLFGSTEVDNVVQDAQRSFMRATRGEMDFSGRSSPTLQIRHRKTQSMTDIDVDDCVQDTGVTAEEISSFIQGPFPEDQKWSCLYEEIPGRICGKRFARKENAKSHVQTHLGDRQYVCKVCQTPFVRQHDLKRHFKIHTTEKPHRCPCGKDFHRHDALTRHRQRGMCVGAYEGSPKKVVKRGRPKKTRPSNDERMEKAAKTRQHVMERTRPGSTYASSISESSDYSLPSPPSFDNVSIAASSPSLSHRAFECFQFPEPCSQPLTPPTSPERCPQMLYESPLMQQSYTSKVASKSPSPKLSVIPELPQSSGKSDRLNPGSHHNSPPELDPSSSSPATSHILDLSALSEIGCLQGQSDQRYDFLNPQVLSGDFQLFDHAARQDQPSMKLEDFMDFSSFDSFPLEKQSRRVPSGLSGMKPGSQGGVTMSQLDDPFVDL